MVIKHVGENSLIDMGTFKLIHKGSYALENIPLLLRLPPIVFNIYLQLSQTT